MATLKVILHEARDLPVMDRSTGLSDPFVALRLDSTEFISHTCTETRYPVWNTVFRFDTPDLLVLQEDPLEVRIYQRDMLTRNPLVGFVNIDCNSFMYRYNPTMSGWFPLYDDATGLRGEIRLTLRIKFHAAGNPLAPRLVERLVSRLPLKQVDETGVGVSKLTSLQDLSRHQSRQMANSCTAEDLGARSSSLKTSHPECVEMPSSSRVLSSSVKETIPDDESKKTYLTPHTRRSSSTAAEEVQETGGASRKDEEVHFTTPGLQEYGLDQERELEPISAQYLHPSTFASEEEGVHIFSVSRLDPFVYRVEATYSMVEELLVKADPEHFPLTNLRSSRNVNRARLVQLFKLSGKVRRQLAHKVIGLRCNAVLGYAEQFDMEPYGIIVRAYGTPCVVSTVKSIDLPTVSSALMKPMDASHNAVTYPHCPRSSMSIKHDTEVVPPEGPLPPPAASSCERTERIHVKNAQEAVGVDNGTVEKLPEDPPSMQDGNSINTPGIRDLEEEDKIPDHVSFIDETKRNTMDEIVEKEATPKKSGRSYPTPSTPASRVPLRSAANPCEERNEEVLKPLLSGSRHSVITLSVKELPSGCIQHIGGYICARSVKIISKSKSKPIILQERDVWWMELREELRANARAFHCNAILGYEEISQYQDDVALLALSGTAVMIPPSMISLRGGPDYLFRSACARKDNKKDCSILHIYNGTSRKRLALRNLRWSPHSFCKICNDHLVPNFLLGSCHIPSDVELTGPVRLIEVHVAQHKKDVKNVDLAKVASQELPFIEFALHKQLIFQLQLQHFNACFGMKVSIVLGPDAIVGTLTGTGCSISGLPTPSPPRMEIVDPFIKHLEPVKLLHEILQISKRKHARDSDSSSSSSSASSNDGGAHRRHSIKSSTSSSSSSPSASWVSSNDSQNNIFPAPEQLRTGGGSKLADVVVKIDDEEEADLMLGMIPRSDLVTGKTSFYQGGILLTVPYIPSKANAYYLQHQVVIIRRYNLCKLFSGVSSSFDFAADRSGYRGSMNRVFNNCCADAKEAFFQAVNRLASCTPEVHRIQVVNYRMHIQFEQRSHDMHMRLEGLVVGENNHCRSKLRWLEEQAFRHCVKMISTSAFPPLTATAEEAISLHQTYFFPPPQHDGRGARSATTQDVISSSNSSSSRNVVMQYVEEERWRSSASSCSPEFSNDEAGSAQGLSQPPKYASLQLIAPSHYKDLVQLFVRSVAPFSLPYVFRSDVGMLKPWFPQMKSDRSGYDTIEVLDRFSTYDLYTVPQRERKSVSRRVRSWISSLNHLITGSSTTNTGSNASRASCSPPTYVVNATHQEGNTSVIMEAQHCPILRVPNDDNDASRQHFPTVVMSGLDYVPGFRVVRYLGRLSQHFIREDTGVITPKQLGAFYQAAEHEVLSMVQSMVILQGGNALLQYSIVFHEIEDSEGSGNVSALITVTGDAAQVTDALEL